ncbi:hypothetical protein [Ruegeria atlantica]|nr:hypothetical protein [Ruegeria atlantica]
MTSKIEYRHGYACVSLQILGLDGGAYNGFQNLTLGKNTVQSGVTLIGQ